MDGKTSIIILSVDIFCCIVLFKFSYKCSITMSLFPAFIFLPLEFGSVEVTIINLCKFLIALERVQELLRVWIVRWLQQGIVIGHAHSVPKFIYIEPPPPES